MESNRMSVSDSENTTSVVKFEFVFNVSCVKRYVEEHTFTQSDVEYWCECRDRDRVATIGSGTENSRAIVWSDLTAEEKAGFFQYFSQKYNASKQMKEEEDAETHDYNGERDCDEDFEYDDGFPESVESQWDKMWRKYFREDGEAVKKIKAARE